jgi:cobalt-precorrin-5B (C1)-methyltransferase
VAALRFLVDEGDRPKSVTVNLINPAQTAEIAIDQLAPLPDGSVLAITYSDPGDNLDLTRHTPLWSIVTWGETSQASPIHLEGGEGIGRQVNQDGSAAIYRYAKEVMRCNLENWLPPGKTLRITVILPEGRALAERTSNAAFGVVDGLSLLGTSGISEPLSAPGQLDQARQVLRIKAAQHAYLVFCVGENGLDLAVQLGIDPECRVKTANWLGPMLVEASQLGVAGVLLLGYHGKLIKLAGGIFHTHHHVADGRQEILAACCAEVGVPLSVVQDVLQAATVEAGLAILQDYDRAAAQTVYRAIAARIDARTAAYVYAHTGKALRIGAMLFNRQREIIARSKQSYTLFQQVLIDCKE